VPRIFIALQVFKKPIFQKNANASVGKTAVYPQELVAVLGQIFPDGNIHKNVCFYAQLFMFALIISSRIFFSFFSTEVLTLRWKILLVVVDWEFTARLVQILYPVF
jgi:hypothetical protein